MRLVAALGLAIALLAGCSSGEQRVDQARLGETVLQPADLGEGYREFDEGPLVRADSPRGEAGWRARYRWEGPADAAVPLVVESRVDLFESTRAAKDDVRELRERLEGEVRDVPELGDEAAVTTFARAEVRFLTAVWRERNVVATLNINGFDGKVSEADLLALARKHAGRLAGA